MVMQRNRKSRKLVVKSARPNKTTKHSSGGLFGKWLIVFVCTMIIGYLIVDIICGFKLGQFLPDVLTTSWFAFWGVELINLVVIKRTKIRAQYPDLIETVPDSVNINLRSKEEFGNFSSQVHDLVNNSNLENPLSVADNIEYNPAFEEVEKITSDDEGGNQKCLKMIY